MQLGFDNYLDVMLERPELFKRLMEVNEEFEVAWANAQLQAGATAIVYFDPVAGGKGIAFPIDFVDGRHEDFLASLPSLDPPKLVAPTMSPAQALALRHADPRMMRRG